MEPHLYFRRHRVYRQSSCALAFGKRLKGACQQSREIFCTSGSGVDGDFNVTADDYIPVAAIADLAVKLSGLSAQHVEYKFTGGDPAWKARRTSAEAAADGIKAMLAELNRA